MKKKINIGVIGCGYWGPNLIRNFNSLAGCRLKTVCDLDERRLRHMKELYPAVDTTRRMDDLIEDAELDAIVVATSVRFHYPMAKKVLEAGKHVFIEKPMARSSAECEELNAIAAKKGLIIMIGHTFLYSSPVRKIKELVQAGEIGKLCYISSRRLNLGLFQKDINVMWDLAPHDLSIILYIMDEHPLAVNCQGNANVTVGIEDIINLSLTYRNGRFATVQNSWLDPRKVREMTIVGTKKMIVYDDIQPLEKIRIYDARVERPPHYDTFAEFQYSYHYGDLHVPYVKQEEPLKVETQHFIDCINSGARPISSGHEGLELVRILESASLSLQQGGAAIPLSREEVQPDQEARVVSAAAPPEGVRTPGLPSGLIPPASM
ncbi:MAG TPA: gfo/Idh/MocA family oxidoreductase [Verrucomicrobiales bacterium]|nr:gfo/Idh/MocA family oxidoreductase [Verrucomicrobiales bacterium]